LVLLASLAGWATGARAEVSGSPAYAELAQARLSGATRYTYWGFDIYQARLWVEPGFASQDPWRSRFALELQYLRDFKGRDIAQRSLQEMRKLGPLDEVQAQAWLRTMQSSFPDVVAGDRLAGIYLPGQGIRFMANGKVIAQVDDIEFARRFLGIWLSEKTSEPQMRLSLLGLSTTMAQP
jgi:hypothetical protein